ncbi:Outer membrane protein OmpA [Flavobacterium swingsii]|uniref:Outer membrane protein OmpA n=1 Tax=Flavobacterium swingsii TaxID=498292 RepID=A0A1I0YN59_9FLAO|nr:OmpA family protein [Flavobacterium swingsii]SFB13748.1 Outer membrane protein OmpA [Flavobacterium swingsii]
MKNSILLVTLLLLSNIIFAQDSFIKSEDSETSTISNFDEAKDLYTVVATAINTKLSDVGSTFFMGKYIMYSSRKTGAIGAGRDENTNNPYNGLYCLNMDRTGNLSKPSFFAYALDSKGNEGGLAFSPDEKTVYYTKSAEGNSKNYQLYKSIFDNAKYTWIKEIAADFNSVSYSIENPSITPDGKKMYFSSNMPGGFGGFDIYVAEINKDGMPINPTNLGQTINTNKDEKFAYASPTNKEIYFSSNGHNGYGGQDVFVSKIKTTRYTTPLNLGKTINTSADEVAFILATKNSGYVTSNRAESAGLYDIYHFELQKNTLTLKGLVTEKQSKIVLPNTKISLIDEDGKEVATQISSNNGSYNFEVEPLENYTITAKKDGYLDFELPVITANGNSTANIELNQTKAEIKENTIAIENIYFDFNKASMKTESTLSLNKILEVLNTNTEMKIVINAHTDARGSDKYNMILSDKRAQKAKEYLITKGINPDRLEAKGYGETKLLSNCKTNCSEAQFDADRRVEFVIR